MTWIINILRTIRVILRQTNRFYSKYPFMMDENIPMDIRGIMYKKIKEEEKKNA